MAQRPPLRAGAESLTSSIARMNCFLHGIEDFQIVRGDTLSEPKLVQGDRLQRFDVVLANPPYSIKQWDRDAFAFDPWGRNLYGTPLQGRADHAFWHLLREQRSERNSKLSRGRTNSNYRPAERRPQNLCDRITPIPHPIRSFGTKAGLGK